jgi:hypothetical protein
MAVHILGQAGTDANEPAGFLPGQVAQTALKYREHAETGYTDGIMGMVEKTLRKVSTPAVHTKVDNKYRGVRHKVWKSRETGLWIWAWPERGFVHVERDDGYYKKWTIRDALQLAYGFGEQSKVNKYADERQNALNAYLILAELCKEAKAQGDPTIPTDAEKRALKESIACATLPGYGPIPEKKVSFVGSMLKKDAS